MDRPHLILVPGLLCDQALWSHQQAHLGDVTATAIVADTTQAESIAEIAASILAVAPPAFALAGLSMGGYICFEILRQAPERVSRLALLDTTPLADTEERSKARRSLIDLSRRGKFKGVTPRLVREFIHPDRLGDQALTQTISDMAARVGAETFVRQQTAILGRPDSRGQLGAITCPTLVLCGRQDTLTPLEIHREMAGAISGARLAIIEDSGHLPPLERPQAVTALLRDWLLYR